MPLMFMEPTNRQISFHENKFDEKVVLEHAKQGQTYKLTPKEEGIKSPEKIFSSRLGDCDDFAVLFYQSAKQLGYLEGVSAYVATINENEKSKRNIIGHANLILNIGESSSIFDLTHMPPFRKFGGTVEYGTLPKDADLKGKELEIANEGRNDDKIENPAYAFFESPTSYFHYCAGMCLSQSKKVSDAKLVERELILSGVKNANSLATLANAQLAQKDPKKTEAAIANSRRAVRLAPNEFRTNYGLGMALSVGANYAESIKYAERAYSIDRSSYDAAHVLAVDYSHLAAANYDLAQNHAAPVQPSEFKSRLDIAGKFMKYSKEALGLAASNNISDLGEYESDYAKSVLLFSYELIFQGKRNQVDVDAVDATKSAIGQITAPAYYQLRTYILNELTWEK